MIIGFDITSLIYNRGVSKYTSNLVSALLQQPDTQLRLFGSSLRQNNFLVKSAQSLIQTSSNKSAHQISIQSKPLSLLEFQWKIGASKISSIFPDLDIYHSWDWLQPPDKNLPLVSTIHDLTILKFPKTAHPKILKNHRRSWKILKEREAEIIAVSRATKKDIVELLDIPSFKVHVVPEALPTEIIQASESLTEEDYELLKTQLELNKPYIFFIGTREPRKNLINLIKAWKPLSKEYQLIIAGDIGWDKTEESQYQNNPDLRFLGKVTNKQLSVLYSEAACLAFPSIYEGFGLPILEAFYHGTPVVTSNISAMIEVAGNAAEFVEPKEVESIRRGIENVLNESKQDEQKRLQRMIIRLQMFSWDRVAKDTIAVYQKAIRNKN